MDDQSRSIIRNVKGPGMSTFFSPYIFGEEREIAKISKGDKQTRMAMR